MPPFLTIVVTPSLALSLTCRRPWLTGDTPVSQGLRQVNDKASDGVTTIVKKGGMNVAATGGTDAARYLYLAIDPAFKQGLKSVWVTVNYFDEGKDGFNLDYDGP